LLARILNFAAEAEQQLGEQKRRIAELEAISTTDELTGLANRRGLEHFLDRTLAAAQRHNEEGVLVFIDLDQFKSVNDTYGHDVGDAALKTVADTLKGIVRSSDMVARLGGDEFVAVLVRCPTVLGPEQAEKLETALTKVRVRHGRRIIPVSASCGFAVFGPGSNTRELLTRADKMMYERKMDKHANGRD
jgi:diguanylate cyclase (GGDEF)-like protein